jgi:raffinose/stachyose/melibiose transport system substrate-binding protein
MLKKMLRLLPVVLVIALLMGLTACAGAQPTVDTAELDQAKSAAATAEAKAAVAEAAAAEAKAEAEAAVAAEAEEAEAAKATAEAAMAEAEAAKAEAETAKAEAEAAKAEAEAAPAEERVLKVWHYESEDGAMGIAWDEAMKEFEATHPGVTIEFERRGFEEIRQTASMILSSDEAPDVMEYNKGNATSGLLSKEGLLTDMTEEVEARGWDKILVGGLQTTSRYENGVMGSGPWYGVTNYGEFVMVYYNKDMFAEYGVEVPTTLEEFEAVMDKFVEAGITPLAVGASEYPAQHIFYLLVLSQANRDWINAFELYQGDVDFQGPEFTFGAEKMAEWVEKGYISKDATGIPAEDMGVAFMSGQHPICISGSWWYGRFMNQITDFEWGSFLFPGNKFHPGSGGNLWIVPTNSKNKDLAYDFIDITMQKNIQTVLGNAGGLPVNADLDQISDPKVKELAENFKAAGEGLAFYPDWPVPGYYDMLVAEIQELIAGTKTPSEVLDSLAAPYEEYKASIE